MSSEGSVSTNTSSRIRQFGLYRTIDAKTEEFLRLSRKRQIKQGCACAAISTAVTVTVLITVFLVYMEYGTNTDSNQQPLGKTSWIGLLNDTLASTFEEKFSKSKLNFDRTTIKLLPLLIKALKQNRYLEKIIEDYSSPSPAYDGKVTTEFTFKKDLFANANNWLKKPASRLYTIEYKTSPISYYKKPSKDLTYFTKIRKIRDYKRIMEYVDKMISDKAIDHTLPILSDEYATATMKPPKKIEKSSKKMVKTYSNARNDKSQKISKPSEIKRNNKKQVEIINCKCPKQLSIILNKIVSSIHQLLPDNNLKMDKTKPCPKQQASRVTTTPPNVSYTKTTTSTTPTTTNPTMTTPTTTNLPTTTSITTTLSTTTPNTTTPTTMSPTTTTPTTTIPTTTTPTTTTPTTTTPTTTTPTTTTPTTTTPTTTIFITTTSNKPGLSTRRKTTYPIIFSEFDNIFRKEDNATAVEFIHNKVTTKAWNKLSFKNKNIQPQIKEMTSQWADFKVTTMKQFIAPTEINRKFSATQPMTAQPLTVFGRGTSSKEDLLTTVTSKKYTSRFNFNLEPSPQINKIDFVPIKMNIRNPTTTEKIHRYVHKFIYPIYSNDNEIYTSTSSSAPTIANDSNKINVKKNYLFKLKGLNPGKRLNSTLRVNKHPLISNYDPRPGEVLDAITPTESYISRIPMVTTTETTYYKGDHDIVFQNTATNVSPQVATPTNKRTKTIMINKKKFQSKAQRKQNQYGHDFANPIVEDEVDKFARDDDYHDEYNVKANESMTPLSNPLLNNTSNGTELTAKIEKEDIWKLLKSKNNRTNLNSTIPVNRQTHLEIYRNGWNVDENEDYDFNMK